MTKQLMTEKAQQFRLRMNVKDTKYLAEVVADRAWAYEKGLSNGRDSLAAK